MENIKGVLVPTDFSPTAWKAVMTGIRLAKGSNSPLTLMHITPYTSDSQYVEEIDTKLRNISENLSGLYSLNVKSVIGYGDRLEAITNFIREAGAEIIVMGLNGTGSNEIGSMTGEMLRHLECPVVVVPAMENSSIPA
ncbi:universal stress protein [Marinoscillum sp. MHG1-6]|uniref:universal stress protein n=1 Tax=Marinoscillum sp. MHG1-6 TaxID=2959627 RepID=UPI002158065C|nr:universal stress protein [Marinoscillum sp. MHG1-6]